ncbi:MAG: hypothetical protein H7834_11740 [Magnetococcus sp. YQC-9]
MAMLFCLVASVSRILFIGTLMGLTPLTAGMAYGQETEISHEVICRKTSSCLLGLMAKLPHAPFPYDGIVGDTDQPFYDYQDLVSEKRFHTTSNGTLIPESPHFRDNRVLIHLSPTFQPDKPYTILVFFHGHNTELNRTLIKEMGLLRQINASGRNLVLVAPQMALNAADSSPGKLYCRLGFARMLEDVSHVLGKTMGAKFAARFNNAPVVLAAYSGGYRAVAYTLDRGLDQTQNRRVRGIILLDALYGELDKFDTWLQQPGNKFMVNLYSPSSTPLTLELKKRLQERGQLWSNTMRIRTIPHKILFLSVRTQHDRIMFDGPPQWPLSEIIRKMIGNAAD